MDLRGALDGLAQHVPDADARALVADVAEMAGALAGRVIELERQVESLRIDMLALGRRLGRMDGASGR